MSDEQKNVENNTVNNVENNAPGGMENTTQNNTGNTPELKPKGLNKKLIFGVAGVIALAVIVLLLVFLPKNATAKKVSKQLSLGEKYLSELNYEQAIAAYELAIQIDPKNEDAYIGLAEVYIQMGNFDKAEEVLKDAEGKIGSTEAIRKKLKEIEEKRYVYGSIDGLQYTIVNGKEVVIAGHEDEQLTELVIPDEIEGLPVTEIGYSAFRYRKSLVSVKLPDGLKRIDDSAFSYCGIKEIKFPDGLEKIGDWAFAYCEIKEIAFPESLTEIGSLAFYWCSSLTEVVLPAGVTTVGSAPFTNCDRLAEIRVVAENPAYCSVDGVLYSKDKKVLIQYPAGKKEETYKVLDGTVEIGDAAFDGGEFSEILLPEGLEVIGLKAFRNCYKMTDIVFPSSLKKISMYGVFSTCPNIDVKQGNEYFAVVEGILYNKEMTELIAVPVEKDLANYHVPDGITVICHEAFAHNKSLVELELPESVAEIHSWAFFGCTNFRKIVIPKSVEVIDRQAFDSSENLTIYTPAGSYAETFAKENNIPVVVQ